jgi:hypothetical protein
MHTDCSLSANYQHLIYHSLVSGTSFSPCIHPKFQTDGTGMQESYGTSRKKAISVELEGPWVKGG